MDKYIGRLLDNRYEILEEIGSGGMAVVYKARCHRLNRLVAIKILKDDYLEDEDFRRRFHAESHAVAMLSHPNIVQVYDVFDSDEADYIVMELIDGISLKQYMEKKGVLNWKETLHFAMQIAKALEHAHSRGIVHRDIKPHNVMVLKNGSVKVTDFGIARMMSKGNTLTKEALGSVHYISPEQAKGGRVDNRSDIYSLGVVMYEMMSGRPPYDGESPVAIAIKHINGGAVMPSTLNPNIPGGLEQIIMKAMAHDVADRYESASAMLKDLDEFRKDPVMLFDYNTPTDDLIPVKRPAAPDTPENKTPTMAEQAAAKAKKDTPQGEEPKFPPRRRARQANAKKTNLSTIAIISCSVVMLAAIIILLVVIFGGNGAEKKIEVPDLLGEAYSENMEYTGFTIKLLDEVYDDEIPAGHIVSQEPKAGIEVVRNTTIFVQVSKGKEEKPTPMPNVVNQNINQVEQVLKSMSLQLDVKVEHEYHDTIRENLIIRTDPVAETELEIGQKVTLYVSLGKKTQKSVMITLAGQTLEKAKEMLDQQELDLVYADEEYEYSDTIAKGSVVRTEPEKGQPLVTGQTVKLIVSLGKEPRVPEVEGKSVADVKSAIALLVMPDVEIEYVMDEIAHDTITPGLVAKTEPAAGASLVDVDKITIYISTGPIKNKLPNVVGKAFEDAKNALIAAGFENIDANYVDSAEPAGTVVGQSPAEYKEEVAISTEIVLDVSNGPTAATKVISIDTLPQNMTEVYTVKVYVWRDNLYVLDSTLDVEPNATEIEIEVTGTGVQSYRIVFPDRTEIIRVVDFSK